MGKTPFYEGESDTSHDDERIPEAVLKLAEEAGRAWETMLPKLTAPVDVPPMTAERAGEPAKPVLAGITGGEEAEAGDKTPSVPNRATQSRGIEC